MRKSYLDDKVVSVRFNYYEMERLQYVFSRRSLWYPLDSVSGCIKRLVDEEYDRLQKKRDARSLPGMYDSSGDVGQIDSYDNTLVNV